MNTFSLFLATALLMASARASAVQYLPTTTRATSLILEDQAHALRDRIDAAGGCNVNLCFSIDGSSAIQPAEFENQRSFVMDLASIIGEDEPIEYAAVQYGTGNSAVSPLTPDMNEFILRMEDMRQLGGLSNEVAGISYCFSQLFRRPNEANKIIFFGEGRSGIGAMPLERADLFRSIGGEVCAVGAGFTDDAQLLRLAGGDKSMVFELDNFLDVLSLQQILEDMVVRICKL